MALDVRIHDNFRRLLFYGCVPQVTRNNGEHNSRKTWLESGNWDYGRLFRDSQFLSYTLCDGLVQGGMYAYIACSSFVLMDLYGLTPGQYILMFGINSLGMILAAQFNVRLLFRFTPRKIIGTTLAVIGTFSLLALFFFGTPPTMMLLTGLFLFLSCIGFIAPNAAAVALESQGNKAGTASALLGTILSALGALFGFIARRGSWKRRIVRFHMTTET